MLCPSALGKKVQENRNKKTLRLKLTISVLQSLARVQHLRNGAFSATAKYYTHRTNSPLLTLQANSLEPRETILQVCSP